MNKSVTPLEIGLAFHNVSVNDIHDVRHSDNERFHGRLVDGAWRLRLRLTSQTGLARNVSSNEKLSVDYTSGAFP